MAVRVAGALAGRHRLLLLRQAAGQPVPLTGPGWLRPVLP
jgi:hypothetical protein